MRKAVNYRPICFAALALACGILAAAFVQDFSENLIWRLLPLGAGVISFVVVCCLRRVRKYAFLALFAVLGVLALSGAVDVYNSGIVHASSARVEARVTGSVVVDEDGRASVPLDNVTVNGERVKGSMVLWFGGDSAVDFDGGDYVGFVADVDSLELLCFDSTAVSRYCKGTYYYCETQSVSLLSAGELPFLARWRYNAEARLYEQTNADTAGIAVGLLFGDKRGITDDFYSDTAAAGLAHILAVSGLHIGILAAAVALFCKRLNMRQWTSSLSTLCVLLVYGAVCGFPPSVIRAVTMFAVASLAPLLGKKRDDMSSLSLAALLILAANPLNLFSAGFLLSVFTVLGILTFYPAAMRRYPSLKKPLWRLVTVSLIASVFSFPVTLVFFGRASVTTVFANLLIIPILSLLYLFVLFITLFVSIVPSLSPALVALDFVLAPIKAVAFFFGSTSVATLGAGELSDTLKTALVPVAVALLLSFVVASPFVFFDRRRKAAVSSTVLSLSLVVSLTLLFAL